MEVLIIVGIIAAIFLGTYIWGKITSAASAGVNKHVFNRSAHQKGQILQSQPLLFRTTGPKDKVRDWIIGSLEVRPSPPMLGAGLTIEGTSGDTTRFALGSSVSGEIAAFDLDLEQHGTITTGTLTLLRWQESDGVMSAAGRLEQIHSTVRDAVLAADSQSTVNSPLSGLA